MNSKYIVELKKWYSEEYHKKGIVQLSDYLERQNQEKGYLLIFDPRIRKKEWKQERDFCCLGVSSSLLHPIHSGRVFRRSNIISNLIRVHVPQGARRRQHAGFTSDF
jgi:hypothetical protein